MGLGSVVCEGYVMVCCVTLQVVGAMVWGPRK